MTQVFQDYTLNAYSQNGIQGALGVWPMTLLDFSKSVIEEHLEKETVMTKEKYIRFSSWSFMAAGVVMLIGSGFGSLSETTFGRTPAYELGQVVLISLMMLSFCLGFYGLRARYGDQVGGLARSGVLIGALTGGLGFVAILLTPFIGEAWEWGVFYLGMILISIGMAAFGLEAMRTRILSKLNWVPFVAGIAFPAVFILEQIIGDFTGFIESVYIVVFFALGLGTITLGYLLHGDSKNLTQMT